VEHCDAHHVIPWAAGGTTSVENLALLCPVHHTAVHARVYVVEMREGVPWVRLPTWVDYRRPWLKNLTHHRRQESRERVQRFAHQFEINLSRHPETG
jgi:HNH endonuclease